MSVDSERMLKLENKVKELETYINKIMGFARLDLNTKIQALQKSVNEIKVYNKAKAVESEAQTKQLKKELQSDTDRKITYNNKMSAENISATTIALKESPAIDIKSEIKSVVTKEYINKLVTKEKPQVIDLKGEIESVVNKQYINAIYRNK